MPKVALQFLFNFAGLACAAALIFIACTGLDAIAPADAPMFAHGVDQ